MARHSSFRVGESQARFTAVLITPACRGDFATNKGYLASFSKGRDISGMNSLKLKFLGLTGIILVIAVIGTTWYNLNTQRSILQKMTSDHAHMVAETVSNSVMVDMANGRNEQVGIALHKIGQEKAIASLRIFDETGRGGEDPPRRPTPGGKTR